jgi:hypothetical protein
MYSMALVEIKISSLSDINPLLNFLTWFLSSIIQAKGSQGMLPTCHIQPWLLALLYPRIGVEQKLVINFDKKLELFFKILGHFIAKEIERILFYLLPVFYISRIVKKHAVFTRHATF